MSDRIVTRFAPSPTGYLHVGGARTALFNWLWARRTGGTFILRIEDTDQRRNTPTATQQVLDDLRWLGIQWDEGPEVGGPNGPYLQSQRKDIYNTYVKKLLEEKKAYYCFDTIEQLDEFRDRAGAQKEGFSYQRPVEFPTDKDAENARAQGRPVTVRFAVPQGQDVIIQDVVRGEITFAAGEIGDFIIQKNDCFPTYNFACVVDDYLMKITHIIRGQEHLNNTPAQQMLWGALGFGELPKYAHMSVTVSDTGGKLSKRERPNTLREEINTIPNLDISTIATISGVPVSSIQDFMAGKTVPDMPVIDKIAEHLDVPLPEINIIDFFRSGYLPETMVNFLALLGWNPGDDREIMQLEELIESFDIARLTKSNSLFDRQKLLAFNTEHIRIISKDKLLGHLKAYLKEIDSPMVGADDKILSRIINLCEGARTLVDIERKSRFLFIDDDAIEYDKKAIAKVLLKGNGLENLVLVRERLDALKELSEQSIEDMLRGLAEEKKVGLGKVAQPLRVAICGSTISTPIFESVQMLTKERTLARIDQTIKFVQGQASTGGS